MALPPCGLEPAKGAMPVMNKTLGKTGALSPRSRKRLEPYLLLLPAMLLIGIFKIYPILYSLVESFFKLGRGGVTFFAGFRNYASLFAEPTFANSLWVTLWFCVFTTAIQVLLAIALSLFLNRKSRAVRAARTMIYLPVSISIVIACTVWNLFFSTSTGIINTVLETFGLAQQPFLTGRHQALYVIVFICCWKGVPYWMMFLLAGLQNINESIYEASRLDGAGYWVTLFRITLPMLKNALVFVVISDTLINVFMFVPVYLLTGGGPSMSTDTLMYEAYRSAFSYGNYPRAYALVTVMMGIAIAIAAIQMFLTRDEKAGKARPYTGKR